MNKKLLRVYKDITLDQIILESNNLDFNPDLYHNFKEYCFACRLKIVDCTEEDVIPKWMIRDLKLTDTRLKLSNNQSIRLNQIKIPCCEKCNNNHLSRNENYIKKIFEKSPKDVTETERIKIFYWSLKVFLGTWLKTRSFKKDRSDTIENSKDIKKEWESNRILYALLKTMKYNVVFTNFQPFSIYLFEYDSENTPKPIFYMDDIQSLSFSFAYKKLGFIITFGDGGYIRKYSEKLKFIEFQTVNTVKLTANFSRLITSRHHFKGNFTYMVIDTKFQKKLQISQIKSNNDFPFVKWDTDLFRSILERKFDGLGLEVEYDEKRKILSTKEKTDLL